MAIFNSSRSPRPSRVLTLTTATSVAINVDIYDAVELTALASACEFTFTGTPLNFQRLIIAITDSGGPRALTWTGDWLAQNIALPSTTAAAGRRIVLEFMYSSAVAKWLCVSYLTNTPDSLTAAGAITAASFSAGSGSMTCGLLTASLGANITPRVLTSDNQTSVTPTTDYDVVNVTSVNGAGTFTFNNPTGTPSPFQEIAIYAKATGTNAMAWGSSYQAGQNALYTEFMANKMMYMHFIWDPTAAKWYQRYRGTQA